MVPVKEFFEYFNVHAFHGIGMTDVENIILYGLDAVTLNQSLPSSTDLSLTNEIKSSIDEDQEHYQNSILSKFDTCINEFIKKFIFFISKINYF